MGGAKKLFVAGVVTAALVVAPAVAMAVGGFAGPTFGLATAPNGDLMVADAGAGIVTLTDGVASGSISLPGVTDVAPLGVNSMWATIGAGVDPTLDTGQALYRVSNGKARQLANLYEFEVDNNPDGQPVPDSNPFDVHALGGNAALVADAGANALLEVDNRGNVEVKAIFPVDDLVSTANFVELAGCPSAAACGLPEMMQAQSVPTSIAVGPDGGIYVGELKGFPGPVGESHIWRVSPDASGARCGESPDCVKVFDGGFTSIIDLVFGPDGDLYVAEMDELSWAAVEIFEAGAGGTVNACDLDTLSCSEVATGIPQLTAMTFDGDGDLWVSQNVLAGSEVVELP